MSDNKYICIHGHFYQPPRENPWLEDVELQNSAQPYHDWNERITAECYKNNAASRILDKKGNIIKIVNNYTQISFNFGPTLLTWLEKHQPEIYNTILEADRISQKRFNGHGSAIAQPYNHMIMPLANRQDKINQVFWGIKDFQSRFGRDPEGMWLPETAVDYETLEVLAQFGIKYTILAPHQAARTRNAGEDSPWQEVQNQQIDSKIPYYCPLPSGKNITIFFYNGSLAHDLSFGDLLKNGEKFAQRLINSFSSDNDQVELVHLATDGETFGHHHRFGDMALAYCLYYIEKNKLAQITNYGEYLELNPPTQEVQIAEKTSWSCPHGVERWQSDCGCKAGSHPHWQQKWRKPLREALDWLRDYSIDLYQKGASAYLSDVWQARNEYIDLVLNRTPDHIQNFLRKFTSRTLKEDETIRALKYLEIERNAILMYTSCGWFFDDISRIETVQNLRYAARLIQLIKELDGIDLEDEFLKKLAEAPGNTSRYYNGAIVYQLLVKPAITDLLRVGAHYAITTLFNGRQKNIYAYQIKEHDIEQRENGTLKTAIGYVVIQSKVTLEQDKIIFAVLYLGGHNVNGRVARYQDEESYQKMLQEIDSSFQKAEVVDIIRLMDKHFGTDSYSLQSLFKDEQRQVLEKILEPVLSGIENNFLQTYLDNSTLINFLRQLDIPIPKNLNFITEEVINQKLKNIFVQESIDLKKLIVLLQEIKEGSIAIEKNTLERKITEWIHRVMTRIKAKPLESKNIEEIIGVLKELNSFQIQPDLWEAQNIYYGLWLELIPSLQQRIGQNDEGIQSWWKLFQELGTLLNIGLTL